MKLVTTQYTLLQTILDPATGKEYQRKEIKDATGKVTIKWTKSVPTFDYLDMDVESELERNYQDQLKHTK